VCSEHAQREGKARETRNEGKWPEQLEREAQECRAVLEERPFAERGVKEPRRVVEIRGERNPMANDDRRIQ